MLGIVFKNETVRIAGFLAAALVAGTLRQFAPSGISWVGAWPTGETDPAAAYRMMALDTDPPFLPLDGAVALYEAGEAVFLDARSPAEYAKARIPGARLLPFHQIEEYQSEALRGIGADTAVVVYCEGVGCTDSLFLARALRDAGYRNLRVFYGGLPQWARAGFPTEP